MQLERASASDTRELVETLARAFHDDAAFAWFFPDEARRRARVRAFFRVVVAEDLVAGEVWRSRATGEPGAASDIGAEGVQTDSVVAALWRAPGRHAEAPLGFLATYLRFASIFREVIPKALAVDIAMARHRPKKRFWYLRYLGVAPFAQGRGWGGLALRRGIEQAQADATPIYLETTSETNVRLYERFGFGVTAEWVVPRSPLRFWSMLRVS